MTARSGDDDAPVADAPEHGARTADDPRDALAVDERERGRVDSGLLAEIDSLRRLRAWREKEDERNQGRENQQPPHESN